METPQTDAPDPARPAPAARSVAAHRLGTEERRRRERPLWRAAMAISVALHLLVFVTWPSRSVLQSPFAAAGPRAGDVSAAGGSLEAINLQVPPSRPITMPPVPTFTIAPVDDIEFSDETAVAPAQFSGAPGVLEGPGVTSGTGAGDGGNAEEGRFRLTPPVPRGMIWPPDSDRLDRLDLEVWVFVDERGRVVADSTRLQPPTSDRDFNRRLIADAAEWVFEPARQGGRPVGSWFPYRITR